MKHISSVFFVSYRFGAGTFDIVRAAGRAFKSGAPSGVVSRQPKVQELETNEIPQQKFILVPSNAYIPTFRGTYAARSPYWLTRR